MSKIKNKQHYVFQTYLKNWCNKDEKLWCYKKSEKRIFPSSTNDVLNKRQMYKIQELNSDEKEFFELVMDMFHLTDADKSEMRAHIDAYLYPYANQKIVNLLKAVNPISENNPMNEENQKGFKHLEDLINEQKINTEEDFYSDYEGNGKVWIDKLIAGSTEFYYSNDSNDSKRLESGIEIPNYEKYEFLHFVCIQYFRTVGMREQVAENIQNMLTLSSEYKNTPQGKECIKFNFNPENINPEHILPHFIWIIQAKCSAGLVKADIQIVRNKTNKTELPFITSDQPVINMKADASANKKEIPKEFVLWYPLSPEVGVIINGEQGEQGKQGEQREHGEKLLDNKLNLVDVEMFNQMIWNHSFEYVVSDKKEVLEEMANIH